MNFSEPSRPRPANRPTPSTEIVRALRERIVTETLAPGQRLPTHAQIERQFRSTTPTVAKALEVLRNEGFIESQRGRGIFVSPRPPHRHHYALAMYFPKNERLSRYYVAIRREAMRYESAGRHMSVFYDIGEHTDVEDYQQLLGLVRAHRLAGVIFANPPYEVIDSPILDEPNVPRVVIATTSYWEGIPSVSPAGTSTYFARALDEFAARGRKRVAILTTISRPDHPDITQFKRAAQRRGMTFRASWIHGVNPDNRGWASNVMQAMLAAPAADRPDALLIMDDNVVKDATAGIARAQVRVPEDLEVIAHANFPHVTPSAVPARRLGYDVRRLLALCLERLEMIRCGQSPPPATWVPPLFEEELNDPALAQKVIYPVITIGWGSPSFPAKLPGQRKKRVNRPATSPASP